MINTVIIAGNLTRDPEVKYTPSGKAVCNSSIAVNEKSKDRESTHFIEVVFWGKTAELIGQYCKKGSKILVDGRLNQESYEDKETGKKISKIKVVCETMQFLSGTKRRNNDEYEQE